jgi:hypothetical protein
MATRKKTNKQRFTKYNTLHERHLKTGVSSCWFLRETFVAKGISCKVTKS